MYNLTALIYDQDGKPLDNVNVQEVNLLGAPIGNPARTNTLGRFSIVLTSASSLVKASHVGYEDAVIKASDFGAKQVLFSGNELDDVVITPKPKNTTPWGAILVAVALTATVTALLLGGKEEDKPVKVRL